MNQVAQELFIPIILTLLGMAAAMVYLTKQMIVLFKTSFKRRKIDVMIIFGIWSMLILFMVFTTVKLYVLAFTDV